MKLKLHITKMLNEILFIENYAREAIENKTSTSPLLATLVVGLNSDLTENPLQEFSQISYASETSLNRICYIQLSSRLILINGKRA